VAGPCHHASPAGRFGHGAGTLGEGKHGAAFNFCKKLTIFGVFGFPSPHTLLASPPRRHPMQEASWRLKATLVCSPGPLNGTPYGDYICWIAS